MFAPASVRLLIDHHGIEHAECIAFDEVALVYVLRRPSAASARGARQ